MSSLYENDGSHENSYKNLIQDAISFESIGRGKLIKKFFNTSESVKFYSYLEFFPVDITYHTESEAKEVGNNEQMIDFVMP